MRVEGRDRDTWPRDPGRAQGVVRQAQVVEDALAAQQGRHVLQGNVGGHAGVPEAIEDVELLGHAAEADRFRGETDLVVVAGGDEAHRRLVEGREADRISLPLGGHGEGAAEIHRCEAPALLGDPAEWYRSRIEVPEVDQHGPAGLAPEGLAIRHHVDVERNSGHACALCEHARIAGHRNLRCRPHRLVGQDLGRKFGRNPGCVPHRKSDPGAISRRQSIDHDRFLRFIPDTVCSM
jgi:hypothetical protein